MKANLIPAQPGMNEGAFSAAVLTGASTLVQSELNASGVMRTLLQPPIFACGIPMVVVNG